MFFSSLNPGFLCCGFCVLFCCNNHLLKMHFQGRFLAFRIINKYPFKLQEVIKLGNIALLLAWRWMGSRQLLTGPQIQQYEHLPWVSQRRWTWNIIADYLPSKISAQQESSLEGDIYSCDTAGNKTPMWQSLLWLLHQHDAHFSASSHWRESRFRKMWRH